jgi:hypothetical protein
MENGVNTKELNSVIRQMQDESIAKHLAANGFNQAAHDLVQQGVDDKMRSRGWPVTPRAVPFSGVGGVITPKMTL